MHPGIKSVVFLAVILTSEAVYSGGLVPGELLTDVTRFTEEERYRPIFSIGGLGTNIDMTERTIVAGKPDGSFTVAGEGSVDVLELDSNGIWTFQAILTLSNPQINDHLGSKVGVSGNTVIASITGSSKVYVFEKPAGGWTNMTETAVLTPSHAEASFGFDTAISGDTVVVGAPRLDDGATPNTGAIYLFNRPTNGWVDATQDQRIINPEGFSDALFGTAVDIDGDRMIIGAPTDTGGFSISSGVGWVFERSGTTWNAGKVLLGFDRSINQRIGGSVSIHGQTLVLGTGYFDAITGNYNASLDPAAYVYVRTAVGWNIFETAKLDYDSTSTYGAAVAIHGDDILVGKPLDVMPWFGFPFPEGGGVYLFNKPSGGWIDTIADSFNPLHPSDTLPCTQMTCGLRFGRSVSLSSHTAIVGASGVPSMYIFVDPLKVQIIFGDSFEASSP